MWSIVCVVVRPGYRTRGVTQALIEAGTISAQEAKTHRYRNVLYRYLGTRDGSSGSNATEVHPQRGNRYILCSDGVTDGVPDAELARLLQTHDDPQAAAEAIVLAAQAGGSRDNITCAAIFVILAADGLASLT